MTNRPTNLVSGLSLIRFHLLPLPPATAHPHLPPRPWPLTPSPFAVVVVVLTQEGHKKRFQHLPPSLFVSFQMPSSLFPVYRQQHSGSRILRLNAVRVYWRSSVTKSIVSRMSLEGVVSLVVFSVWRWHSPDCPNARLSKGKSITSRAFLRRVIFISLSLVPPRYNAQSDEYHKQGIPGVRSIMVFPLSLVPPRYNAQSGEYHKQGIPGVHRIMVFSLSLVPPRYNVEKKRGSQAGHLWRTWLAVTGPPYWRDICHQTPLPCFNGPLRSVNQIDRNHTSANQWMYVNEAKSGKNETNKPANKNTKTNRTKQ